MSCSSEQRCRKIKLGPHHDSPFLKLDVLHHHCVALPDGKPSRSGVSHGTPTQPPACPARYDGGTEAYQTCLPKEISISWIIFGVRRICLLPRFESTGCCSQTWAPRLSVSDGGSTLGWPESVAWAGSCKMCQIRVCCPEFLALSPCGKRIL